MEVFVEFTKGSVSLPGKEAARLAYTFYGASPSQTRTLIVFVNGLMLPRSSWEQSMHHFLSLSKTTKTTDISRFALLSYDRYGQGESDPDPTDIQGQSGYCHDTLMSVRDLRSLLDALNTESFGNISLTEVDVILVCNSIGCAIARLFAQTYPTVGSGFIFLDSIIANSDLVSYIPDPDAPDFDQHKLREGVTIDMLRRARVIALRVFHPSVKNPESLDRRNLAALLPDSDQPMLGLGRMRPPYLTIVEHDPVKFADDGETGSLNIPRAVSLQYHSPFWHEYNLGLVKLTETTHRKGPITAVGCGHFIHRDDPGKVAELLLEMLTKVQSH